MRKYFGKPNSLNSDGKRLLFDIISAGEEPRLGYSYGDEFLEIYVFSLTGGTPTLVIVDNNKAVIEKANGEIRSFVEQCQKNRGYIVQALIDEMDKLCAKVLR